MKHFYLVNTGLKSVFTRPVKCNPRKQILALQIQRNSFHVVKTFPFDEKINEKSSGNAPKMLEYQLKHNFKKIYIF